MAVGTEDPSVHAHLRLGQVVEEADDLEPALAEEAVALVAVLAHAHQVARLVQVLL